MRAFIDAWARFVIARRAGIIGVALLLVVLTLTTGGTIPFDNSTERYFIPGDPALLEYDSLYENFGDNEYLIVGIEASESSTDVFTQDALDAMARISEFLEFHPYVTQLRSLSNYQYIHADGDDLRTDYLIDDIYSLADDPMEIERVKTILAEEELAIGTLITEDFRHTRIAARVEYSPDSSEVKVAVTQDLYRFLEEANLESSQFALHLSG
jgi:predicted RND superfamily exporter protein